MREIVDTPIPVTMVGSYPRPLWFKHQLAGRDIRDALKDEEHAQAYEDAVACVVRDQEEAGLDIVTDGQMYFDNYGNSIGSFLWYWYERIPGFESGKWSNPVASHGLVTDTEYDLLMNVGGTSTSGKVGRGPVRLAEVYDIGQRHATKPMKVSVGAGPINLSYHVHYDAPESFYKSSTALAEDLVPIFNAEMKELAAAGATFLQLEDLGAWHPIITGNDSDAAWVVKTINATIDGVDAKIGWHFCLGNAYGNAQVSYFGGELDRILPPLYETKVDQFVLDFALRDMEDIDVLKTLPRDKQVAAGVIDVRRLQIETPAEVADRMRRVLEIVPTEQVSFTTDCGMRALPRIVAQGKLRSMAKAAELVRREL